ncbi:pilus assembly PilX family protein [Litoribrevibacter albus]|uniref:Type 4 fimbrial biogenesis protein PilX N-terminal domain-containing protein n=1 Tax=Litoribrevibacter albus TaxID=1473156 RepID=A0AA37SA25_9GAMM|nr:hypothetical protein [Litoribrevibacter albus]GLQ31115.1 hypothetical protein GCM10007876_15940 [Litoribrevibacter albus]
MKIPSSPFKQSQEGAVLLLSLIMVLVLSISAIAMVNVNNVNQQIIRNQINTMEAEQVALEVIESLLNGIDTFETAANEQIAGTIYKIDDGSLNQGEYTVSVLNIRCTYSHIIDGYSLTADSVPETNYFEFDIEVASSVTGATTKMTQGVRFNSPAGLCP